MLVPSAEYAQSPRCGYARTHACAHTHAYNTPRPALHTPQPIVLEKLSWQDVQALQSKLYAHAKHAYAITDESRALLRGTLPCMSSYFSRNAQVTPLQVRVRSEVLRVCCVPQGGRFTLPS
jgi:hypothetical protein